MFAKKYLVENYDCGLYLFKYEYGYCDEKTNLQILQPLSETSINSTHNHLVIGYQSKGEIELCIRFHRGEIWAFHKTEEKFQKIAGDLEQLIDGFKKGTIKF